MTVRARLTAWYTLVLAVVLIAAGAMAYVTMQRELRRSTDQALATNARQVAAALLEEKDEGHGVLTAAGAQTVLDELRDNERPLLLYTAEGRLMALTNTPLTRSLSTSLEPRAGFATVRGVRFLIAPTRIGNATFLIAAGQSLAAQNAMLAGLRHAMLLTIPLVLLVASVGGYLLARKSLAPVEEAYASQRRFMADASHELRTPVSILQGEIDVALSRPDRDARDYRDSLEIMRKSVRRLTRIVQDLFLLARADAGQYPLTVERFYLDDVVAQTVQGFRTVAAERGVALTETHEQDLAVRGDEDLVQRLVGNLVDNALKHAPPGGSVAVRCTSENGSRRIEVRDSGPGIDAALRDKIFERFVRVGSGAGLGLPIARWIAEAHGGRVWLERSDARGSVFVAVLPGV